MRKSILTMAVILFCAFVLALTIRGLEGSPTSTEVDTPKWTINGPLELSPERGRYALLYSFIEDGSFQFSPSLVSFATPDVAMAHGRYVSLFAPGVSFLVIPGYLLGKLFGLAQVGAFSGITLFALGNVILLNIISRRLGASPLMAALASFAFIFATPALAYAVSLYQHHISVFLILLSIYILIRWDNIRSLFFVWFLFAFSVSVDYPNLFMMLPVALGALGRLFITKKERDGTTLTVKTAGIFTFFGAALPIMFFLWFNQMSYGNPYQLSGTLQSVENIEDMRTTDVIDLTKSIPTHEKTALGFFMSRNLLNGFYIHLISLDRGIIHYAPIVIFAIPGVFYAIRKKIPFSSLLLGISLINILLYSMWGDPWGGWAFGSRYLIPSYAILAIFLSLIISKMNKSIFFMAVFFLVYTYSVAVNVAGAITTSKIPPQVEILNLEKLTKTPQKYTYEKSFDYLWENRSKSYIFQTYLANRFSAWQYYFFIVSLVVFAGGGIIFSQLISKRND